MTEKPDLAGVWIEIREDSTDDKVVFRPVDFPIPPSRGGRRQLDLDASGTAKQFQAGPADKPEQAGNGSWSLQDDARTLNISLPGWEGVYDVEEATEDMLVLRRK